jgi:Tfp pilus assembly protein PilE
VKKNNVDEKAGFTLAELLIVVVLLMILAGLPVPYYSRLAERSRGSEALNLMGQLRSAIKRYSFEIGWTPGTITHYLFDEALDDIDVSQAKYFSFNFYNDPNNDGNLEDAKIVATRNNFQSGGYTGRTINMWLENGATVSNSWPP